jgi:hypothetical protein
MTPGNGAQKFSDWMEKWLSQDKTHTKKLLADRLRVSPAAIHQWAKGYTTPLWPVREDIERETDGVVTCEDWGPTNDRRKPIDGADGKSA